MKSQKKCTILLTNYKNVYNNNLEYLIRGETPLLQSKLAELPVLPLMRALSAKDVRMNILITGATGFIGRHSCRCPVKNPFGKMSVKKKQRYLGRDFGVRDNLWGFARCRLTGACFG